MLPDLNILKGHVTEIHGAPDSGKTNLVLDYIKDMQDKYSALTYYIDAASKLKADKLNGLGGFVWFSFDINSVVEQALIDGAGKNLDIIVVDDFTFYHGDVWRFVSSLRNIARFKNVAILLINQRRHVLNHKTNEYEDLPYRFNVVRRYCTYSLDVDTHEWSILNAPKMEGHLDDFTKFLIQEA